MKVNVGDEAERRRLAEVEGHGDAHAVDPVEKRLQLRRSDRILARSLRMFAAVSR